MVLLPRAVLFGAFIHAATAIIAPRGGTPNADPRTNEPANDILDNAYTVELNDGASLDDLSGQLESLGIIIKPRRVLDSKLFKGVSFDIVNSIVAEDGNHATALENSILSADAAKLIWPVRSVFVPLDGAEHGGHFDGSSSHNHRRRRSGEAAFDEPYVAHVITQVDLAHDAGFTGKGVRIAILDSGIDEKHPLLGGCVGPECILASRWDAFGVDVSDPEQFEAEFGAWDCRGHGTHIAGIIGALPNDLGFRGAAPGARLSDYRVMGCASLGTDEHIVAGMLRAFDDGMDILSMSIGFPTNAGGSVLAEAAARIVEAGVPVFAAVGNEGQWDPMFSPGAPSSGEMVSSVASYKPLWEPTVYLGGSYKTDDDEAGVDFSWRPATSTTFGFGGADELVFPLLDLDRLVGKSSNVSEDTGCSPLPETIPDLSGFLVMVEYTTAADSECSWDALQQQNIFERGGSNILFWERSVDRLGDNPEIFVISNEINVGWVTSSTAELLRDSLAAGQEGANVTVTLNEVRGVSWTENKATGGQVSESSSWGPNWDMRAAPSFGAPGHKILSTIPGGGLEVLSGTSMATPLVAGAAALLIEATGSRDPQKLHNRLASTSRQVPLSSTPYGDFDGLHPPTQAGAGMVQIMDAIQAKGVLSMTSISFNDSDHHVDEVTFTLENTGTEDAVYTLNHVAARTAYALGTNGYLDSTHWDFSVSSASIAFSPESGQIRAAAGEVVEITVRCRAPDGVDRARWPVYSGYITLNGTNNDNLVIPYVGNAGSMRDAMVISAETTYTNWEPNELKTIPRPLSTPTRNLALRAPSASLSASPSASPSAGPDDGGELIPSPEDDYFLVETFTPFRTRHLQVHLIPAAGSHEHSNETAHSNGAGSCSLPTHEWLGHETFGQVSGSPRINGWPGSQVAVEFAGMLANEKIVPEGHYALMLTALRVFSDTTSDNIEDWQIVTTNPFFIKYRD